MRDRWSVPILIVAGIGAIPFIVIGVLIGSRILSGAVDAWSSPSHTPEEAEILGYYQLSEVDRSSLEGERIFMSDQSGFRLAPDHKLEVIDLLALDAAGNPRACNYNGTGEWNLNGSELDMIILKSSQAKAGHTRSCDPERLRALEIRGRSAPYSFWYMIGDPDEHRGVTYSRR